MSMAADPSRKRPSCGEQQMLAIGCALMSAPRLLLIDELSLGLMPRWSTSASAPCAS
jgi:branched-chain amino acid transport system ATP-binding protein